MFAHGIVAAAGNHLQHRDVARQRIGRFGWKANQASIASQTAGAFLGDIGITSTQHPDEACTPTQKDCLAAPRGAQGKAPEIDDRTLSDVITSAR